MDYLRLSSLVHQVRLTPGIGLEARQDLLNGLRTFFRSDATIAIDTLGVIDSTKTATDLMNLFFQVCEVAVLIRFD
jgi:hypothetical protein